MKPVKFILAAHDFSAASKNALELAAQLAQQTNSTLCIYHVISTSVLADSEVAYTYSPESDIKRAVALLKRGITYLRKRFPNIKITYGVDYGFLIPSITSKVEELKPWVTIVGVKKRTGFDKVVFGDVCETLVGKIKSPLLVIPMNYRKLKLGNTVYAWDGKTAEVHQLEALKEIIHKQPSRITALNISHYDSDVEKNASNFKKGLKKMFPSTVTDLHQVQGLDVDTEFEKELRRIKPDMLVVFAHHYNLWQSIFHKRFSRQVFKFTKSPLLVVS